MFVETKTLPDCLKDALRAVDYNKRDIAIEGRTEMSLDSSPCFTCSRGFTTIIDLANGTRRSEHGSWGGANPLSIRLSIVMNEFINLFLALRSSKGNVADVVVLQSYIFTPTI